MLMVYNISIYNSEIGCSMKVSIKNLTKKQLTIGALVAGGVLILICLALVLSIFFKDTVAISVGEVKIYSRDYNRMVKQAEEAGMSKKDLTDILIEYYQTKEAARIIGLNVPEGYIKLATKKLQETSPNLPESIAIMQSYGSAVSSTFIYGNYNGINGRMVWAPYVADDVNNEAFLSKDRAKSLLENAHNELKNNGSDKGIDELAQADINMPPTGQYVFTDDGRFIKDDGLDTYKPLPVSPGAAAEYVKSCTSEGVCDIAEDKSKAAYFFIQNYFRISKIDTSLAEKLESEKQKIKVVDYVN